MKRGTEPRQLQMTFAALSCAPLVEYAHRATHNYSCNNEILDKDCLADYLVPAAVVLVAL